MPPTDRTRPPSAAIDGTLPNSNKPRTRHADHGSGIAVRRPALKLAQTALLSIIRANGVRPQLSASADLHFSPARMELDLRRSRRAKNAQQYAWDVDKSRTCLGAGQPEKTAALITGGCADR